MVDGLLPREGTVIRREKRFLAETGHNGGELWVDERRKLRLRGRRKRWLW